MLDRNLDAIRATDPDLADRIAAAEPEPVDLAATPSGLASPVGAESDQSRYGTGHGVAAFAGFGLGYHIRDAIARAGGQVVAVVYEPSLSRLRGVLERVDHSGWLGRCCIVTDPRSARLSVALHVNGVYCAMGVSMLPHGEVEGAAEFFESVATAAQTVRTMIHTNIVLSERTMANHFGNLARYAACPGVADLKGSARGRPAIVVSAGPSLDAAMPMLADPATRERFVVIATQTVLKAMLAAGARPHYVCALDYHDISARFYDGLTAVDVEGVTMVVEPKVSPLVPAAFPGPVRFAADPAADAMLGLDPEPDGQLKMGATVAHLCYYLARHMGCDPVVLVGQDLCYPGGRYYADCVARQVWADALDGGASLSDLHAERMRVIGPGLREWEDEAGRPVTTDLQLLTYLDQFEREFEADGRAGLTVIDASGGLAKRGTRRMGLGEVQGGEPETAGSDRDEPSPRAPDADVPARRATIASQASRLADLCREGVAVLESLRGCLTDPGPFNAGVERLDRMGDEAVGLEPAFSLAQRLSVLGMLARARADRADLMDDRADPVAYRRGRVARDLANLRALGRAAGRLAELARPGSGCDSAETPMMGSAGTT